MSLIREGELCGLVVFASDRHSGGVLFETMIIDWPKIEKINGFLTSFYPRVIKRVVIQSSNVK